MKVSAILPSRKRPGNLKRAIENLHGTALPLEIIIVLDSDDNESIELANSIKHPEDKILTLDPSLLGVGKFNKGAKEASGDWFLLAADDIVFPTGYLEKAFETPNKGFIGFLDDHSPQYATHYLVSRDWLKTYQGGVFVVPHYYHWGVDVEASIRAQKSGTFVFSNVKLVHHHYLWDKSVPMDETYNRGKIHYRRDLDLLWKRRDLGFPNDFRGYL